MNLFSSFFHSTFLLYTHVMQNVQSSKIPLRVRSQKCAVRGYFTAIQDPRYGPYYSLICASRYEKSLNPQISLSTPYDIKICFFESLQTFFCCFATNQSVPKTNFVSSTGNLSYTISIIQISLDFYIKQTILA